jgi:hypothetical protein
MKNKKDTVKILGLVFLYLFSVPLAAVPEPSEGSHLIKPERRAEEIGHKRKKASFQEELRALKIKAAQKSLEVEKTMQQEKVSFTRRDVDSETPLSSPEDRRVVVPYELSYETVCEKLEKIVQGGGREDSE